MVLLLFLYPMRSLPNTFLLCKPILQGTILLGGGSQEGVFYRSNYSCQF